MHYDTFFFFRFSLEEVILACPGKIYVSQLNFFLVIIIIVSRISYLAINRVFFSAVKITILR